MHTKKYIYPYLLTLVMLLSVLPLPVLADNGKIHIWEGTKVKARGVTMEAFLPQNKTTNTAVIICPGGSYCWLDMRAEGRDVAKWLNENGITAFLLSYRTQGLLEYVTHSRLFCRGNQHPDMITDLQRALQLVREKASTYDIDPNQVGVMGFSAGGHLVMSAACYSSTDFLKYQNITHSVNLRPSFVASVYPVVSMSHPVSHKRSRRALLGERGKKVQAMRDSMSLEKHVPRDCPPVFLINCVDDHVVKYRNSELLDSALTAQQVEHMYIQYKTGGHGFGASKKKGTAESRQWKEEFIRWLAHIRKELR